MHLRLFPLNTVLFPGMPLPLHIFEERYRLMIRECIERDEPFGVVLIREGAEVGGPAVPFDVGTSARIRKVEKLEDDRLNILTVGESRFRILTVLQERPYLLGEVEWLEDLAGEPDETARLLSQVTALYTTYYQLSLASTGQWAARAEVPAEPGRLADFVAARLQVPPHYKQGLLETLSLVERLRQEAAILEQETKRVGGEVASFFRAKYARFGAQN